MPGWPGPPKHRGSLPPTAPPSLPQPPPPPWRDFSPEYEGAAPYDQSPSSSTSITGTAGTESTTESTVSPQTSGASHFSISAVLHDLTAFPSDSFAFGLATEGQLAEAKLKGQRARSLLRMLVRHPKSSIESEAYVPAVSQHLIPCGDVAGLLAVNVKLCKDFTPKFVVKRDTYLLVRISIDKIMKCTNPQIYRANVKQRKNNAVTFGDTKYFSVKVPAQKSDPKNRITLELVGFEGPKDFPRLFGNMSVHLYEVIQKQSFTQVYAMRIRNMVVCSGGTDALYYFISRLKLNTVF